MTWAIQCGLGWVGAQPSVIVNSPLGRAWLAGEEKHLIPLLSAWEVTSAATCFGPKGRLLRRTQRGLRRDLRAVSCYCRGNLRYVELNSSWYWQVIKQGAMAVSWDLGDLDWMIEQILEGWCRLGQVPREVGGVSVLKRRTCQSACLFEGTVVERFQKESLEPVLDLPLCLLLLCVDNWLSAEQN